MIGPSIFGNWGDDKNAGLVCSSMCVYVCPLPTPTQSQMLLYWKECCIIIFYHNFRRKILSQNQIIVKNFFLR